MGYRLGRIDGDPLKIVVIQGAISQTERPPKRKALACSRRRDGKQPVFLPARTAEEMWPLYTGSVFQGESSSFAAPHQRHAALLAFVRFGCWVVIVCVPISSLGAGSNSLTRASWCPSALLPGYPRPLSKSWGKLS